MGSSPVIANKLSVFVPRVADTTILILSANVRKGVAWEIRDLAIHKRCGCPTQVNFWW